MTEPRTETWGVVGDRLHDAYIKGRGLYLGPAEVRALLAQQAAIEAEAAAGPRPTPSTTPQARDEGLREALDQIAARTDDEEVAYWVAQARTAMQRAALADTGAER